MLLTISTTHQPATDLGFLLHKHPDKAHVYYPEANVHSTANQPKQHNMPATRQGFLLANNRIATHQTNKHPPRPSYHRLYD